MKKEHIKKYRLALLIGAVVFMLSACSGKSTKTQEEYEITVGLSQSSGAPLVDIAFQEGYFEDENLKVNRVPFANSADGLNALQAGKIDIGASFGTAGPLTFIANGSKFTIIGGQLEGGHPILVKKENKDKYKSLEDFKGKKVGTIRIFTSDIVFRSTLAEAGINWEEDLEIIEFKTGSMLLEAVQSGKVDVAVSANSFYAQAQKMGLEAIGWSNDLDPSHVCCRVVTREELLGKYNGEEYKRFLKAIIRAERKKNESPEAAVTAAKEYMSVDDEVIDKIVNEEHSHYSADPSSEKVVEMWEQMQDIGYIDNVEEIDINSYINIELYENALKELIEEYPDEVFYKDLLDKFYEQNT